MLGRWLNGQTQQIMIAAVVQNIWKQQWPLTHKILSAGSLFILCTWIWITKCKIHLHCVSCELSLFSGMHTGGGAGNSKCLTQSIDLYWHRKCLTHILACWRVSNRLSILLYSVLHQFVLSVTWRSVPIESTMLFSCITSKSWFKVEAMSLQHIDSILP